ncbi:hypothetical protein Slin15195_G099880 [Septoria linicola]|uniref:Uncharacterized protein n=1 Tax=Septoria linicola TaxID=215465 RepID=A0A9Q9ENJ8_9PEZI|nr:hypothetical protein Slin15195_G099880 [Septoria linicola]
MKAYKKQAALAPPPPCPSRHSHLHTLNIEYKELKMQFGAVTISCLLALGAVAGAAPVSVNDLLETRDPARTVRGHPSRFGFIANPAALLQPPPPPPPPQTPPREEGPRPKRRKCVGRFKFICEIVS